MHRHEVIARSRRDHKLLPPLPQWSILPAASDEELRVRILLPAAVLLGLLRVRPILITQIAISNILRIGRLPLVVSVPCHPVMLPLLQVKDRRLDRRDFGLSQGLLRNLVPSAASEDLLEVWLQILRAVRRLRDGEGSGKNAV